MYSTFFHKFQYIAIALKAYCIPDIMKYFNQHLNSYDMSEPTPLIDITADLIKGLPSYIVVQPNGKLYIHAAAFKDNRPIMVLIEKQDRTYLKWEYITNSESPGWFWTNNLNEAVRVGGYAGKGALNSASTISGVEVILYGGVFPPGNDPGGEFDYKPPHAVLTLVHVI